MKYILLLVTALGLVASVLALGEHYRPYGDSPCNFNDRWDCGIVNHSPYAVVRGVPVAVIGIGGYVLLALLTLRRAYRIMLALALPALAFSLYLAHIERDVLGVWCLYCVISLGSISLLTLLLLATVVATQLSRKPAA
ncbi:MAG: vitamin K epoxide reductase family protein [Acidobacteria bacterium]|nr:vitamin K epoxide reductase family protein [Acidobacteriota bacterium]MBV9624476.1 vitamin K epoxide reductase family protein [Acidobacteriota bacterium]